MTSPTATAPTQHGNSRPWTDCGGMVAFTREDMRDTIAEAICDSLDADWNSSIGAEAVMERVGVWQLYEALAALVPAKGISIANRNIPDDLVVPCSLTMGELRKAVAALALARGETVHD